MSIYLDHKVETPETSGDTHHILQWSPKHNLLAVASYSEQNGGQINLFFEEGQNTKDMAVQKMGCKTKCLSWHPEKKILASGWSNGEINIWFQGEGPSCDLLLSTSEISGIGWSSNGFRLISTTMSGEVVVYKIDHRGQPHSSPFCRSQLQEPIKCIVLKPPPPANTLLQTAQHEVTAGYSTDGLDKGIKDTLDVFTVGRGIDASFSSESATFFLGGTSGGVYCLRESGIVEDGFIAEKPVSRLLYYGYKNTLLTLTEDLMLFKHAVASDCSLNEIIRVKLSGKGSNIQLVWATPGVLAMSSGENQLRLWDLDNEENCVLPLNPDKGYSTGDTVISVSYCAIRGVLAAGTNLGHVAMWKRVNNGGGLTVDMQDMWRLQGPITLQGAVSIVQWALSYSMLGVSTTRDVYILREQLMLAHYNAKTIAVQTGQYSINLTHIHPDKNASHDLRPDISIKGLYVTDTHLATWDGYKVIIYETDETNAAIVGNFQCTSPVIVMYGQNVYCIEPDRVVVRTLQGTIKQVLPMGEDEGMAADLSISANYLAVSSSAGYLRVFDLARREAKQHCHPKRVAETIPNFHNISTISLNCNGSRISFTVRRIDGSLDSKLYVWNMEMDTIEYFNMDTGQTDQQEFDESFSYENGTSPELQGRLPGVHCWDATDPRLLIVEAGQSSTHVYDQADSYILSFFVTTDRGMLVQDGFVKSLPCDQLVACHVPFLYFTKKQDQEDEVKEEFEKNVNKHLIRRTFREFIGLEDASKETTQAMLNFSYYLTIGNMDEAFKAIKLIKSEHVWENMANMCVKTQRLDVAAVCLGNMKHARAARMLRRSRRQDSDHTVNVATLAIQLGMVEDANRLYINAKRPDLLNKLKQSMNSWKESLEIAHKEDRIHLRNTHFSYARHLESIGAFEGAIDHYEQSDTHRFEVARMLFDNPMVLEQYVKKNEDKYLQRWWAQYLESLGELEAARNYYSSADDYLSVVRILCYTNIDEAANVANSTGNEAACYHLARQYEILEDYGQAVHFFTKANAFSSAIRLAKEHNMSDKLAHLSLLSGEGDMIEAAKFYETQNGQADKAVMLYHKAGMFGRALDLAFRTEQFSALDLIASDLNEKSDKKVLERCAEFFIKNQQYSKAAQLLAYAKQYHEAIDLCSKWNVPISEQLVESMTPAKAIVPNGVERTQLLEKLADCCMRQAQYHYAAKKYTQAGNKIEAMRALLKSGDTQKIIFFANTAKNKEIYVMAGNYLQTTDWKEDPDIIRQIVSFYSKGDALDSLASFYDACAQVEIDEYRDYEKALTALQEATRCIGKVEQTKQNLSTQEMMEDLHKKITHIKNFLAVREIYENDPAEAMKQLQALLQVTDINESVRLGDIYAVLVVHNVKKENYKKAHSYLLALKKRMPRIDLSRYIKQPIIATIHEELNLPPPNIEEQEGSPTTDTVPESSTLLRTAKQHIFDLDLQVTND